MLNTLNDVSAAALLIEALGDNRVPVRTAAAIGLRNLREKMTGAGGTSVNDSIAALRDAGKSETSPVTLERIYQAMDYTGLASNPDPQGTAAARAEPGGVFTAGRGARGRGNRRRCGDG